MPVNTRIQLRRGTLAVGASQWTNQILYAGEVGYETDTGRFKIGDGLTQWSSLSYAAVKDIVAGSGISVTNVDGIYTINLNDPTIQATDITDFSEAVDDRVAALLNAPSGSGISLNYVDASNRLDIGVNDTVVRTFGSQNVNGSKTFGNGILIYPTGTTAQSTALITAGFQGDSFLEVRAPFGSNNQSGLFSLGLTGGGGNAPFNIAIPLDNSDGMVTRGIWNASTIAVEKGGTGKTSYNNGELLIGSGTGLAVNTLTAGSGIGISNGPGTIIVSLDNPALQASNITNFNSAVSGLLPTINNSGVNRLLTNDGSSRGVKANSNLFFSGTNGSKLNLISVTGVASEPTLIIGGNGLETINGTESASFLTNGNLIINKEDVQFFRINARLGTVNIYNGNLDVDGDLTLSGSGLVASNINDFNTAVRTNRLDQLAVPTADVSLNSNKITNLATPTNPSDAATKAYVDASRLGLDVKDSVRVATTANITLSGTQTIDGVSVVAGDRVLVKDQSTGSQNGIYVVAAGAWSRATDADVDAEVTAGMFTFVSEGSTNADSGWVLTTNDTITLGTTALTFAQFSGAGQITAGAGLTKNGSTIDVGTASSSRIVVNADSIDLATVAQSNNSGSAGVSFVQSVNVDSYGRVSGVVTASVQDATTSAKGIASFDSNTFSAINGAVSIKNSGITNSQLIYDYITLGSVTQTLGSSYNTLAGLSAISGTSAGSPTTLTFCVIDGGTP